MSFKYDFDMFSVVPDEMKQEFENAFDELGMGGQSKEKVAMFRDPALAVALQNADDEVRQVFLNAGFGLNVYDSGAPEGCYLASEEVGRSDCVNRLAQVIVSNRSVLSQNWNGFDIEQFLDHVANARPIEVEEVQVAPPVAAKPKHSNVIRLASICVVAGSLVLAFSTGGWSF
ncbi:hypothetical protein ROA7450_02359 [Roseovarius albus]|uniref:Uncharacterized protein n=1 Tax=Roseovarius albus TaxID=1247867 RepID=A0A1X6ZDC5_9RHOB|nr:hypothetical protein [Roseovarius albus]SLN47582.1 hypothetical protein ROA7450_02359 [Roseovarius albus]